MRPSGMILVLSTVLCVPATGRASPADGCGTQTDRPPQADATQSAVTDGPASAVASSAAVYPLQTNAIAVAVPPQRRTGFRTLFGDLRGDFAHVPSVDSLLVAAIGGWRRSRCASHRLDVQRAPPEHIVLWRRRSSRKHRNAHGRDICRVWCRARDRPQSRHARRDGPGASAGRERSHGGGIESCGAQGPSGRQQRLFVSVRPCGRHVRHSRRSAAASWPQVGPAGIRAGVVRGRVATS
jgi:hypothetical protein